MVDRAHLQRNEDNTMGVLLMDMKASFPSLVRGRLVQAMKAKEIDGEIIRRTQTFLSDGMVQMTI